MHFCSFLTGVSLTPSLLCTKHNLSISGKGGHNWIEGHVRVCCRAEPWTQLSRWHRQDCHCSSPDAQSLHATYLNGIYLEACMADSISMTRSLKPKCIWALFQGQSCYSFKCIFLTLWPSVGMFYCFKTKCIVQTFGILRVFVFWLKNRIT